MDVKPDLKQLVCEQCKKGLKVFADIKQGTISKECPRCGHRTTITVKIGK